jgi:hypothetical protein
MRIGTTTRKLTAAVLGLGIALAVITGPIGSVTPLHAGTAVAADQGVGGGQDAGGGGQKKKAAGQAQDNEGKNIDPVTGEQVKNTSVIEYINAIYIWIAFIGGLIAVISLMYAGYSYMASYGDPEKIANAKDIVEKSLIGLSLLILAALILNTINPRTVENPCTPGEVGCGDIDFSKPGGGAPNN